MAFTEVGGGSQRKSGASNDAVSVFAAESFPANVTSGNLLIVGGGVWGSTAAPTSVAVSDTLGTSYTVVLGSVPGSLTWRTFLAFGVAPSSGANAVTVNPAGADATHSGSFSIDEWSGQHATPTDVDGGTSTGAISNGNPFTGSDSLTTLTDNALIIGVLSHESATTALTAGTNYTTIGENESNTGDQCHHLVFRVATTATAYTVTIDGANSVQTANPGWALQTYAFKAAVGSSSVSPSVSLSPSSSPSASPSPSAGAFVILQRTSLDYGD